MYFVFAVFNDIIVCFDQQDSVFNSLLKEVARLCSEVPDAYTVESSEEN